MHTCEAQLKGKKDRLYSFVNGGSRIPVYQVFLDATEGNKTLLSFKVIRLMSVLYCYFALKVFHHMHTHTLLPLFFRT